MFSLTNRTMMAALSLAFTACERPVTVLLRAEGNPFSGHQGFALAAMSYDNLRVDDVPAQTWLSGRSASQRESFETDLGAMNTRFAQAVMEQCGAARGIEVADGGGRDTSFVIRPALLRVDTDTTPNADNRLVVRFYDARAAQVEVILLHASGACPMNYALGTRLRCAASSLGSQLCDYLRSRTGG